MDPAIRRELMSAELREARRHHQRACNMLRTRRWDEAMREFEAAFALDTSCTLDRRTCFDWFRSIQIDEISPFWLSELTRFFRRDDIDKFRYAMAGLQALGAKPAFRALRAAADTPPGARYAPDAAALDEVMTDELFRTLLCDALVAYSPFELSLTRLRRALLLDQSLRNRVPVDFLCDFAQQCFNNEFVYAEEPDETAAVAALAAHVESHLQGGNRDEHLKRSMAAVAMYCPLHTLPGIEKLAPPTSATNAFDQLLFRTVGEVLEERRLADGIRAVGAVTDATSLKVRAQYEANPYPRWRSLDRWTPMNVAGWIAQEVPNAPAAATLPAEPAMLVAGCGTGIETLSLATRIPGLRITAIDLSRASLAYARRMAVAMGIRGVAFEQADILALGDWHDFDIVYCSGVLHHLRDPREGLRALVQRLRPGGLMKLGLYSERARAAIRAARGAIAAERIEATATGIRAFRQRVLRAAPSDPLRKLLRMHDFFTLSECRDMLFHVQEHEFRLSEVAAMVHGEGLEMLGFSRQMPSGALAAYRKSYPKDDAANDLERWDEVEAFHPDLFAGMYHIWCRKPSAG
jgi:2-polyprenyl-3-methyl-5-hydroxy-6-metoxy-1,4-benzoquinol methylase